MRIPARSQRQAMDWSLVLVSQGIESTIDHSEEGDGSWALLVSERDFTPALRSLRLYRVENRAWALQQKVSGVLFDWGSLAWLVLLLLFFWLSTAFDLKPLGLMDASAVSKGEWWRVFTATWLHADAGHLAANATLGVVLLGLAMARNGPGLGLLAAYLTGVGGNLVVWAVSQGQHLSLGASGMVMGCLGLLAASAWGARHEIQQPVRKIVATVSGGVMLFVLFGLAPETDVIAHAGGFVTGLLLGGALASAPGLARSARANVLAGITFVLMVLLPWGLALASGRR